MNDIFSDIPILGKSIDLSGHIIRLTTRSPNTQTHYLVKQIRRSALSVSGNLAEGFCRKENTDRLKSYYEAKGSLSETRRHLIRGANSNYFTDTEYREQSARIDELWRELSRLIESLSV